MKTTVTVTDLSVSRHATPLRERACSVAQAIEILGDGWTGVVFREAYFGVRTFDRLQAVLGLPRTTLAITLKRLVSHGLLHKVPYSQKPLRYEYRLTEAGADFYPVMLALMQFGDRWLSDGKQPPVLLVHKTCGHACSPRVACSECLQEVLASECSHRPGPGAGGTPLKRERHGRRLPDSSAFERARPSSVARTLQIIGDHWSFLILREAFFKARRFEEFHTRLGIARNILTDRLNRFVDNEIFARVRYQTLPERYEYRFTEKGRALFGPMLAMLRWGDDWRSDGKPPLLLTHTTCGRDFKPVVLCDHCREPVHAKDIRYAIQYTDPRQTDNGDATET